MTKKFVLTRKELEKTLIWLQLDQKYDRVMFVQRQTSGIGTETWARFYRADSSDHYQEIEITDLESW